MARGVVAIEACTMAPGGGGVRRTSKVVCTKHQVDEWGGRGERGCAYNEVMMAVSGEEEGGAEERPYTSSRRRLACTPQSTVGTE